MSSDRGRIAWPASRLCRLFRAGRATQADRAFALVHRTSHLVVHLFAVAARVRMGDAEYAVEPGDLTITPPATPERFAFTGNGMHWFVRLVPDAGPGPLLRLARHHRLGPRATEARRRIECIIHDFHRAGGDPEHPAMWAGAAGAHALLCWTAVLEAAAPAPAHADTCVDRAEAILRSLECAALPIAAVARRAGMSQNRLAAAFAARHGTTMTAYRIRQLVEHAKWLMDSTDLPLATIRARLEIRDAQRFNKLFRKATGLSPHAWLDRRDPLQVSSPRPPVPGRRQG